MLTKETIRLVCKIVSPLVEVGAIRVDELEEIKTRLLKNDLSDKTIPEYITRHELAEMLKITTRTLDKQIVKAGRLRFFKPTGKRSIRFLKSDVEKFLMEN